MAVESLGTVEVVVRRWTEDAETHRGAKLEPQVLGAGTFEVGVILEGAFVPITELKAGGVLKKIARHKAAQTLATPEAPTQE